MFKIRFSSESVHSILLQKLEVKTPVYGTRDPTFPVPAPPPIFTNFERGPGKSVLLLLFITGVPITKLFAWGEEDSGGHVL
jgi:hypothetical protein